MKRIGGGNWRATPNCEHGVRFLEGDFRTKEAIPVNEDVVLVLRFSIHAITLMSWVTGCCHVVNGYLHTWKSDGVFSGTNGAADYSGNECEIYHTEKGERRMRVKLGDFVRDKITGFTGNVTAKTEWLNGCARVGVQSRELQDGKPIEIQWIDIVQVEVARQGLGLSAIEEKVTTPPGGPRNDPSSPVG